VRPFVKDKDNKISKNILRCYRSGVIPVLITTAFMIFGAVNMTHIVETDYNLKTDKNINDYKIAFITDIHYGTIQNKKLLTESVKKLNNQNVDFAVLGGDLVDEHTSKSDMEKLFKTLGKLKTRYGIYYIYGNHDTQPYTSDKKFTVDELNAAIKQNNIKILQDTTANINDEITLVGRSDASWGNRISINNILEQTDRTKYIITADHHPVDMDANSEQGVDLEISGHTHGGQIWPIGNILGMVNKPSYGEYDYGNMKLIVSSGHTGWGFPIRTQKHCEYVVINLQGMKKS
ncbi:MAG: metallophosphoesterase, partial [Oscillospiraceae bacterium]